MSDDKNVPSADEDLKNQDIDEGLEEQEALNQAAEQGIYFKDTYRIVKADGLGNFLADDEGQLLIFKTKEEADAKIATLDNPSEYSAAQVREQVQSE
jgi:hypothetical protein